MSHFEFDMGVMRFFSIPYGYISKFLWVYYLVGGRVICAVQFSFLKFLLATESLARALSLVRHVFLDTGWIDISILEPVRIHLGDFHLFPKERGFALGSFATHLSIHGE